MTTEVTVYPLQAIVQDVQSPGHMYPLTLQFSLSRMGLDPMKKPNHYRFVITTPDSDLTFHLIQILHPFNYKTLRLEQKLKVDFADFGAFLMEQLKRTQRDNSLELLLSLSQNQQATLHLRQRQHQHGQQEDRLEIVQLPFTRSTHAQIQSFMAEQLVTIQDTCTRKRTEWVQLLELVSHRNPGLLLTMPTKTVATGGIFSWTGEFADLEQKMKPQPLKYTNTLVTLYQKTMLMDIQVQADIQVTFALVGFLLPHQSAQAIPDHFKIALTSTAFRPRTFQSKPFQMRNWHQVLGMEEQPMPHGHRSLAAFFQQCMEKCAEDRQLVAQAKRTRAAFPRDGNCAHRLDLSHHPDDQRTAVLLRIVEDYGFKELDRMNTELEAISEQDEMAWIQFEYQALKTEISSLQDKMDTLMLTIKKKNPSMLVWLHDRLPPSGDQEYFDEFRYVHGDE